MDIGHRHLLQDVSNHTERQSPRPQRQHEQSPEPFLNHPSGGEVGASEASAAIRSVPAPDLQPPNALFNSHNVLISGGQFNNSRGHQTTNLTINLNQSAIDSPSTDDEPNVSEQAETIHHTVRIPKRQPLTLESDLRRAPELQKSNIIYEGQLAVKGRGYPLWIPNPNKRLPMPYRRRGIGIGDVGIITAFGGFDFLFNICLPRDHPINPRTLPENFYPIDPPIEAIDIHGFSEYMPGSSIASASVSKLQSDRRVSGLSFESSAQEGAILAMPEGANSEELENFGRFREYAAANVEHWYEFVNGPRGREAKNGDIRLVVGCDKSTAWGIAIFANHTQQQNDCRLTFSAAVEPSGGVIGRTYSWAYSGMAEVRAGPDPREVNELKQGDGTRNASSDDGYENQCLFVRTLNITMRDNVWAKFKARSDPLHAHGERSATNYHRNAAQSIARPSNFGDVSNTGAFQSHGVSGNQRSAAFPTDLQDGGAVEHSPAVLISGPPTTLEKHPSDGINAALLQRVWVISIAQYNLDQA
ncbi:hypothetical protein B0H34DRAFT_436166 [Crassisporium funariophilum]|nr:hypothetical protein B0H34DRAFT_436166 [Crassisporium funariophilum]